MFILRKAAKFKPDKGRGIFETRNYDIQRLWYQQGPISNQYIILYAFSLVSMRTFKIIEKCPHPER